MNLSDAERVRYAPIIEGLRATWRDEATSSDEEDENACTERRPPSASSFCVLVHGGLVSVPCVGAQDAERTVDLGPIRLEEGPDSVGFIDDDDDSVGRSQSSRNAAEVEADATEKITTTTETVIQTTTTKTMTKTTMILSDDDEEAVAPRGVDRPRIVVSTLTADGRPIIDGVQGGFRTAPTKEMEAVEQVIHTTIHEEDAGWNTEVPVIYEKTINIHSSAVKGVPECQDAGPGNVGEAPGAESVVAVRDYKIEEDQKTQRSAPIVTDVTVSSRNQSSNAQQPSTGVAVSEVLITCSSTKSAPSVEEGTIGRLQTDAMDAVVSMETTNSPKHISATTSALSTENASSADEQLTATNPLDSSLNQRLTEPEKPGSEPTYIVNGPAAEHSSIVVPLQHHTTARVSTTATMTSPAVTHPDPSVVGTRTERQEADHVRNLFYEYQAPNVSEKPLVEDVILEEAELEEDGEPTEAAKRNQPRAGRNGDSVVQLFSTQPTTASATADGESSAQPTAADHAMEATRPAVNGVETRTDSAGRPSFATITTANVSVIGPGSFTQQYADVSAGQRQQQHHQQQQQRLERDLLQELSASPPLVHDVQSATDDGQRPSSSAEYTRRVEMNVERPRLSEYTATVGSSQPTADGDKQQLPRRNASEVASDFKMFDDVYDGSVSSIRQHNLPRAGDEPLKVNTTTTSTTVIHRTITDYYPNGGGTVDLASPSSIPKHEALHGVGAPTGQAGSQFLAVEIPFHTASDRSTPRSQLSVASSVSSTQQQQQPLPQSNPSKSPTPTFGSLHRKNLLQNQYQISPQDLSPRTLSRISHLNVIVEKDQKDGADVIHHHPVFVKDTSKYWYKPTISREEAINMLKHKPPGTFVVRDSNSFPGAFGLALKVARPPAGVDASTAADGSPELVRHFLIEPSPKGVKLKGCANEPVFGTLAALVYQHSITPLALPCKLLLPEYDPALAGSEPAPGTAAHLNSNQALLERGAACNVTYLCSLDTESLTGPEALRRAASYGFDELARGSLRAIPVHFKVSSQGITLTDNTRTLFFRRHYPATLCTFAGIDPESRTFDNNHCCQLPPSYVRHAPVFGFVARKFTSGPNSGENACHVFAELDPEQPASAVVRFITNVMMPQARSLQNHQQQQQPASTTVSGRGAGQR